MKIATIRKQITPPPGTLLAGYGKDVVSDGVHDDLYISGISLDDGKNRAALLSYDLLGIDKDVIQDIRKKCSSKLGIPSENIILTCTHTHSGPHTRKNADVFFDDDYTKKLVVWSVEAVSNSFEKMKEVSIFHYSVECDENVNRRVILPDNTCKTLPVNKHLAALANGIRDTELGIIYFVDENNKKPLATLVNYAAHPLTCQSGGASSLKITSDYPGVLRECVEKELGGLCVFVSGACGDLHPKGFETGFDRTREMGTEMAKKVIDVFSDAIRNESVYKLSNPSLSCLSETVEINFRDSGCIEKRLPVYEGQKKERVEIQFLRIGDICLVGVPGEMLTEPGLEIKWHSPFRKTYILYNSTAYISYIPHANAYLSGGYEAETSHIEQLAAFKIVSKAIEGLHRLK